MDGLIDRSKNPGSRTRHSQSPIFNVKSEARKMFSGLMSRWETPLAWQCAIPRRSCAEYVRVSDSANGPVCARKLKSSPPPTSSMTMIRARSVAPSLQG